MDAQTVVARQSKLESAKANWNTLWESVGQLVLPKDNDFNQAYFTKGEKKNRLMYDNTAQSSLYKFAATMESLITPRQSRWHTLTTTDPTLAKSRNVRLWMDKATEVLFQLRYEVEANFSSQANECYLSTGAFGTDVMFTDSVNGKPRYYCIHLSEITFERDKSGNVDTVYRAYEVTLRQAQQMFPDTSTHPQSWDSLKADDTLTLIHAVYPNPNADRVESGTNVTTRMKFQSCYVDKASRTTLEVGGYRTLPYAVGRYAVAHREQWGRGPAIEVLNEIQMLNQMRKAFIQLMHKEANPPLLLHDDGVFGMGNRQVNITPGGLNYGGVSPEGRQLIVPMQTGGRSNLLHDSIMESRNVVKDAFLVNLYQILVETPEMTATEVMMRSQEKGQLLAPVMGRQQTELWGPVIERELDIAIAEGHLPPPPSELREDGSWHVVYEAPINKMQQAPEVVGLQQSILTLTPLIEMNPKLMDNYDEDVIFREVNLHNGVPEKFLRSKGAVTTMREDQAEAERAEQQTAMLPEAASAAKDFAQAQQTMNQV